MIYFIQAGKNGPIKIGHTRKEPYERLKNLQTSNHERLYLLAIMPGNVKVEEYIHNKFKYAQKIGEWFYPTISLMRFINQSNPKDSIKIDHNVKLKKRNIRKENKRNRRKVILELWDSGSDIPEIARCIYSHDGGRQRERVRECLKNNDRI